MSFEQLRALTRYSDGLMDLLTKIVAAIPQQPVNYALVKMAKSGLDDLAPLFNAVKITSTARASGRTHRMLIEVVACARDGRSVLILVGDHQHVSVVQEKIRALTHFELHVCERIIVRAYTDLERGGVLAGQRFNAVFEDHFVSERRAATWEVMKRGLTL